MAKPYICRQRLSLMLLTGCLISGFMFPPAVWARDNAPPLKYDLQQLGNILLGKNSNLEALYHQLQNALHQQAGDYLNFGPRLRVNYNYYPQNPGSAYEINEENPISDYEQWGEVSLVYPLIDAIWQRRYSKEEKQLLVEERQALLQAGQLELLLKLHRLYAYAHRENRLTNKHKQQKIQLSRWLTEAKQRYYHKQALLSEVLDLEALQLIKQQLLERHHRNYSLTLIQLTQLAGLESKAWEPVFPLPAPALIPDKAHLLGLLNQHPLVRVHRLKASNSELQLANRRVKPLKLDALLGYIVEEDQDNSYQSGSRLGLRFSIPLSYNKLMDYQKLSLLDEQRRWEAEAYAQEQALKQRLAVAYKQLTGINDQRKLITRQIKQTEKRINFLKTRMEYPLSEPNNPWQRLTAAYQQKWQTQEKLLELDYQKQLAYAELHYLTANHTSLRATTRTQANAAVENTSLSTDAPRGLYIKNTVPLADQEQRKFLLQFCSAKGINRILLNTDRLFASSAAPEWLPEFMADLHQQQVTVWAMGRPHKSPMAKTNQSTMIDPTPVLTYNRQHLVSEGFDGFHLRLEFSNGLEQKSKTLKDEINQLLTHCAKIYKLLKESAQPLKLGLSIPAWYDQLDMQLLADSIYGADELIITPAGKMKPAALLSALQTELQLGREMERRIWIRLDANHFKQAGQPGLEAYMKQVLSQGRQPVGFMIFNYQTYQTLEEL